MRNLKRALSLALASVMLVGMMVVGTSASYNDVDTADNIEAIEVLQEVGIMVGDENGNFNPENLVTRQEMAVVLSNLMDYRVATYKGTAPFADVADWAEPYVAACYTNGLTSGMGGNYYGATENVTTAQAALMLMKALGYFQYQSDFEDDWRLATVKQGNKIELFDDVDSGVKEAMTRNDLAQLVLNTLESGMVEADNDITKVEAGDVKVETGKVNYNYVTSSKDYAKAISKITGSSSTSISTNGYIVELGEKLYDGDLKKTANTSDVFGRPATKWSYKTNNIGTFAETPDAVYTAKMSKDALYDLLGKDIVDDYGLYVYTDGALAEGNYQTAKDDKGKEYSYVGGMKISTTYAQKNSTSASCGSGKGVLTEVYIDSDDETVTVVVVNTYLMQATADYSSSKESVNVSVLTKPVALNVSTLDLDDFEVVADAKEDDYILYTYSKQTQSVEDVAIAEILTGEVTAYSAKTGKSFGEAGGSVTVDGTQYDYAKWADVTSDNGCAVEYAIGEPANIVLDAYGYAIYVDDSALSVGNYVYIAATAPETNLSTKVIADAYFSDGTNDTITVKEIKTWNSKANEGKGAYEDGTLNKKDRDPSVAGWYSWTKNSKDEYTLKEAKTGVEKAQTALTIVNNRVKVADIIKGNSKTIFVVVDKDDDVSVYTGIANVPDITISATDGMFAYMLDKDTTGKAASLIFIDAGAKGNVKNASADSLIYVLKNDKTFVDNSDNETVYRWIVLMDGVETKIDTKENDWDAGDLYEDYRIDSDGYYEAGDEFDAYDKDNNPAGDTDKVIVKLDDATISHSGDTLSFAQEELSIGSDTKIQLVMLPAVKASKDSNAVLSGKIMTDNDADYETLPMTAKQLASLFDGYTVDGTAYIVYDDLSESDEVETIYVVVTAATVVAKA